MAADVRYVGAAAGTRFHSCFRSDSTIEVARQRRAGKPAADDHDVALVVHSRLPLAAAAALPRRSWRGSLAGALHAAINQSSRLGHGEGVVPAGRCVRGPARRRAAS
jgi:hypothetical protein